MGQANSRNRPPIGRSQSPVILSSSTSAPPRDRPRSPELTSTPHVKTNRRSSFRRSVRAFLPSPRPRDSTPNNSPSASTRKRWRSSRRLSRFLNPLPDSPESEPSTVNHHESLPPSLHSPDDVRTSPSDTLAGTPSHSPSSPSPVLPLHSKHSDALPTRSNPSSPAQDYGSNPRLDCTTPPAEQPITVEVSEDIGSAQSHRTVEQGVSEDSHDCKTFVQGSSRDGQTSPPSSPSVPAVIPVQQESELHSDSAQQIHHFSPPGPLVVVQGVVNTSDSPSTAPGPSTSRASRPSSMVHSTTPASTLRPHSFSTAPSGNQPEDRQNARSRLSTFLPRPTSMLSRRASAPYEFGSDSADNTTPFHRASSETTSSDHDGYLPSDVDSGLSDENSTRPRPLSPGSIDVLGTLLRCVIT